MNPAHPVNPRSSLGELFADRVHRRPSSPTTRCATCGASVRPWDISVCVTCKKPMCAQCGTILSVHVVHASEDPLGFVHTYDEELARTGACSPGCAEPILQDALASCLFDDLRDRLRKAKVMVDRTRGIYGPEFVVNLPGLPSDMVEALQRYSRSPGDQRLPFRYLEEGLLAGSTPVADGRSTDVWIYLDPTDPGQYTLLRGQPSVLAAARALSTRAPGSFWDVRWKSATQGIARILSQSGRSEDAARTYEMGGFFDEAGKERTRAQAATVTLDLGQLIQAFRRSGMTSAYRCPSCGASFRVTKDTPESAWRTCEYCGSTIHEEDMADFLRSVLQVVPKPPSSPE